MMEGLDPTIDLRRGDQNLKKAPKDIIGSLNEDNCLGSGGFGTVYKVRLEKFGTVALKKMQNDVVKVPKKQANDMVCEVKVLANLHHQNIVQLLGFIWDPNFHAIIMEYMVNGDLQSFISEYSPEIDPCSKAKFLLDVSLGLSYIHDENSFKISHNDLKASNVLLSDSLVAKICDFGLADWRSFSTEITAAAGSESEDAQKKEKRKGATLAYVSPERWLDMTATSKMGDVYSFGIMAWEVYSEQRPFCTLKSELIAEAVKSGQRPSLLLLKEDTPERVRDVMQQCWHQEPEKRPSMQNVSHILSSIFEEKVMEDSITLLKMKVLMKQSKKCQLYFDTTRRAGDNQSSASVNGCAPIQRNSTDPSAYAAYGQKGSDVNGIQQPGNDLLTPMQRLLEGNGTPFTQPFIGISIHRESQLTSNNENHKNVPVNTGNVVTMPCCSLPSQQTTIVRKVRVPPGPIELGVLLRVGECLGNNWKVVAKELKFSDADIEELSSSSQQNDVAYQMLKRWYNQKGVAATYKTIAKVLFKVGLNDIGLMLERKPSNV